MADHGDAVARQEFEVPKIVFELDSKVYHGLMPVSEALEMAYREAYQAGSADRWVSVEEKLPEIGKEVLGGAFIEATFYDGHKTRNWQQCLQVWTGEKWIDSDSGEEDGATHWFPIPAPPKKEDSHE